MEENSPIDAATHFSPRLENGFGASQGQVGELDEGNAKRIVFLFLRALLFPLEKMYSLWKSQETFSCRCLKGGNFSI